MRTWLPVDLQFLSNISGVTSVEFSSSERVWIVPQNETGRMRKSSRDRDAVEFQ